MSQNGKGSKPRPFSVSYEEYINNWESIFGKKKSKKKSRSKSKLKPHD